MSEMRVDQVASMMIRLGMYAVLELEIPLDAVLHFSCTNRSCGRVKFEHNGVVEEAVWKRVTFSRGDLEYTVLVAHSRDKKMFIVHEDVIAGIFERALEAVHRKETEGEEEGSD